MRVLVVDDASSARQKMAAVFRRAEEVEEVLEAGTGEEAMALLDSFSPDVMTLDLMLPGMSGLDVLEALQTRPGPPRIVVITNYPYPAFQRRCLELGASHVFPKTTGAQQLLSLIRSGEAPFSPQRAVRAPDG